MQDIYIGRQPIFDRDLNVFAYELLFRGGTQNHAGEFDGDQATSQVIVNAFIEIGLDQIVGTHRAFINLTRSFVTTQTPLPFPKDRVVLEVLEDIHPDAEVIAGVRNLAAQGYTMALDDFVFNEDLSPLVELAQIVKIDLMALPREQLGEHVRLLRGYNVKLVAEKIETQEEFEYCKELGFDYFQGYFLSRPNIVQGQQLPPNRLAVLHLLSKLQDPESDTGEIEKLVSHDIALSYKLLRYINSAFFALPKKIDSIRQAVVYLGTQAIKTWVSLLVVAGLGNKPAELVIQAMQRAKMCELLAQTAKRPHIEAYFTVGLFSLLEALMDTPLEKILEALPFTEDIRNALLKQEGPYGEALACVIAYEKGDFLRAYFDRLAPSQMTDTYLASARWADQSANALGG
ncbi:MAG: HDOD domain-containing protein [Gammaproteobacteria bacterium]|nr:HDOD domain-containing protein [Gammaproteobacteria bacterium]